MHLKYIKGKNTPFLSVFPILLLPCCDLHRSGPLVCAIYEIITVLCMFLLR